MNTLNIALPESMQDFINEQIPKKGFRNEGEYICYLIQQEQERVAKSQIEKLLIEGLDSGESVEITDEWWEAKQTALLERLRQ